MFKYIYQARWLLFPLGLILAGWLLIDLIDTSQWQSSTIKWEWLIAAFILNTFYVILYGQLWHSVTHLYGIHIPRLLATAVYLFSNLGKYVPLKIVGITFRIAIYVKRFNREPSLVIRACYIETIASLFAGIISGIILLPFTPDLVAAMNWYWYPLIGVVLFILFLKGPQRIIFSTIFRILRKPLPESNDAHGGYTSLVFKYIAAWFVLGTSLFFLCLAVGIQPSLFNYLMSVEIYILAGVAGILVFIIPSGIGIREGVLMIGLVTIMPASEAAFVTILARISITLSEMICALIAFIYLEVFSRNEVLLDAKSYNQDA